MGENDASSTGAPNLRLTDLLRPFNGQGDVLEWFNKLELIARIKGLTNLENVIPLFLEGSAYSLYAELSEADKLSVDAIKGKLINAYGLNPYVAYEQFMRRIWRDEPVDVYVTDLRRLARLADVESEKLIQKAFVVGLPAVVSRELRASAGISKLTLPELVDRARVLLTELTGIEKTLAAVSIGRSGVGERKPGGGSSASAPVVGSEPRPGKARPMKCYRCGGPHMARYCPDKPKFECWSCGKEGHSAKYCNQGNGAGGATAEVAPH